MTVTNHSLYNRSLWPCGLKCRFNGALSGVCLCVCVCLIVCDIEASTMSIRCDSLSNLGQDIEYHVVILSTSRQLPRQQPETVYGPFFPIRYSFSSTNCGAIRCYRVRAAHNLLG